MWFPSLPHQCFSHRCLQQQVPERGLAAVPRQSYCCIKPVQGSTTTTTFSNSLRNYSSLRIAPDPPGVSRNVRLSHEHVLICSQNNALDGLLTPFLSEQLRPSVRELVVSFDITDPREFATYPKLEVFFSPCCPNPGPFCFANSISTMVLQKLVWKYYSNGSLPIEYAGIGLKEVEFEYVVGNANMNLGFVAHHARANSPTHRLATLHSSALCFCFIRRSAPEFFCTKAFSLFPSRNPLPQESKPEHHRKRHVCAL